LDEPEDYTVYIGNTPLADNDNLWNQEALKVCSSEKSHALWIYLEILANI
jgi:hypothetical protein